MLLWLSILLPSSFQAAKGIVILEPHLHTELLAVIPVHIHELLCISHGRIPSQDAY